MIEKKTNPSSIGDTAPTTAINQNGRKNSSGPAVCQKSCSYKPKEAEETLLLECFKKRIIIKTQM